MTEPDEDRSSLIPIAIAAGVVVLALSVMGVLRLLHSDRVPDDGLVGRAVVGQNDALQREDYTDFRTYTCLAQQGTEPQMLADQRQSIAAKGHRFVDDVTALSVTGERATATVVYHFDKSAADKISTPMTFIREDGGWKVCSPGPR